MCCLASTFEALQAQGSSVAVPCAQLTSSRTVRITVRDSGGEGGASLLTEDTLTVELRAGPPAHLTVEGPATIECGTKATLPQLRVRVCDAAGNPTTSETFEVRGMQTQRRPGLKALARTHTHTHTHTEGWHASLCGHL